MFLFIEKSGKVMVLFQSRTEKLSKPQHFYIMEFLFSGKSACAQDIGQKAAALIYLFSGIQGEGLISASLWLRRCPSWGMKGLVLELK